MAYCCRNEPNRLLFADHTMHVVCAQIAELGGRFSTEAGRESTIFRATVARQDVNAALEVLSKAAKGANVSSEEHAEAAKGAVLCDLQGPLFVRICTFCVQ